MKALRWYGKKDLRYVDAPEPFPEKGQVKVKVTLAGICGSDLKEYESGPHLINISNLPLTIGHEFIGKVFETGGKATGFKPGERVAGVGYRLCGECFYCQQGRYNLCLNHGFTGATTDGCMAEYFISPSYSLYRLPDSVSDEAGALVEPMAVALRAVRRGKVQPGKSVAIVGDGPIGLLTLLAARGAGATEVYVVAKHNNRGEMARKLGATAVIYHDADDPVKAVNNLTEGLGADVTIECVGRPETAQLSVDLTRKGGTAVMLGVFDQPGFFDFKNIVFGEKTVVGSSIYIHEGKKAIALMADKRIDPTGLITSTVPLKNAVQSGFEKLLRNKDDNIKILLKVS